MVKIKTIFRNKLECFMKTILHFLELSRKHLKVYFLVFGLSFFALQTNAQSPQLVKFSTTNDDGRYITGQKIRLEAEFDNWLGINSEIRVRLNTGDTITLTHNPTIAEDFLDPNWGVKGKRNAVLDPNPSTGTNFGVYCILELEGKGGKTENAGKIAIAGRFYNYEQLPGGHDNLVITDKNGQLLQGFEDYTNYRSGFKSSVACVRETMDGGLIAVGEFTDYGGNQLYDYIIKFKYEGGKFVIDHDFMRNLTANNTRVALDAPFFGPIDNQIAVDTDGSIFISGAFSKVGGHTRYRIAKLNADGSVNPNFNFTCQAQFGRFHGACITFDDAIPGSFWWGVSPPPGSYALQNTSRVYIMSKTTGKPTVDAHGFGVLNHNDYAQGPAKAIMGIIKLPPKGTVDASGKKSPGGVLVIGKGTPNHTISQYGTRKWGWETHGEGGLNALQPNLKPTPISEFALGGESFGKSNTLPYCELFDGAAFLMGKIWIGLHNAQRTNHPATHPKYYEGGLFVMNYDGSLNTTFNHMLANATNTSNAGRPDGDHQNDGIGGFGNGGGRDVMSFAINGNNELMVGGNFGAIMQYSGEDYIANTPYTNKTYPDDQMIVRLSFNRASGYYVIDSEDIVPELKILEIISHDINDAFGHSKGSASMPTEGENMFENNHRITINIPILPNEDFFVTKWTIDRGHGHFKTTCS